MGLIYLTRNLRVDASDGLNFTLQRRRLTEKGATVWSDVGHYGNLGDACQSAVRKGLAGAPDGSLQQTIALLGNAEARIKELCRLLAPLRRKIPDVAGGDAESILDPV